MVGKLSRSALVWMGLAAGCNLVATSAEAAVVATRSSVAVSIPAAVRVGPVTHVGATVVRTTPCRPGVKVSHVGRTVVR
jgi:hypothetical protein